ncbi:MAG: alpha/beta hydrolase family protein, partial [Paracoccaceae bacterium]
LPLLHDLGFPVLLVSYRNDPTAPTAPEGRYAFGLTEWPDLAAAVTLMQARGYTDLILVGESMGGAIVGQFMQNSPAAAITAIALDAPALDLRAVLAHVARQIGLPLPRIIARLAETTLTLTGPVDLRAAEVTAAYAAFDGPLFIAHGRADRIVPVSGTEALLAARNAPTISLLTGGDHLQSHAADPEAYRAAFAAFASLIPAPRP